MLQHVSVTVMWYFVTEIPPPEFEVLSCYGIKLNGRKKTRPHIVLLNQKYHICINLAIVQH